MIRDIRLVVFDLDGVLIDARQIHFESLNGALQKLGYEPIAEKDHLDRFDGLPTKKKLIMLTEERGLDPSSYEQIDRIKKDLTEQAIGKMTQIPRVVRLFKWLEGLGVKYHVVSNARRSTIDLALGRIGVGAHYILSPEDVAKPKPDPEIYLRSMQIQGVTPEQTLILEDSPVGRAAARASGAHVLEINDPSETSLETVRCWLEKTDPRTNVLIPMAGLGKRFRDEGYKFPKPLIDVLGKPMIQRVVESLNVPDARYIFLVQKEHLAQYPVAELLERIAPGSAVVSVDGITEGAACTTLLARHLIDSSASLFIANSDQIVEWDVGKLIEETREVPQKDGSVLTFRATEEKWSFARTGSDGCIVEVAEKRVISDIATCGVYYWKSGSDYVKYADQMIAENSRVNNEFYVCPSLNWAIADGKRFSVHEAKMYGLGTPEDLKKFIADREEKNVFTAVERQDESGQTIASVTLKPGQLRIALCLSGHMRTFETTAAGLFASVIKNNVCDVFIHTWKKMGFREWEGQFGDIDEQKIREVYSPLSMVVEDTAAGLVIAPENMFKKVYLCDELRRNMERRAGFTYDCVIRARPDIQFMTEINVNEMDLNRFNIPKDFDHGGINDQFAISNSENMTRYCEVGKNPQGGVNPENFLATHLSQIPVNVARIDMTYRLHRLGT